MNELKTKIRKAINDLFNLRNRKLDNPGLVRDAEQEIIKLMDFKHYRFKEIKKKPKN